MTGLELPGFADPVAEAQGCFRALLDAMARPGTTRAAGAGLAAPPPLDPATAATLLTLADAETALWLDPAAEAACGWIAFHCGARFVAAANAAHIVAALGLPDLARCNAGSDEAPETSATVVLQVAALGCGARYRLSGPGLRVPAVLAVAGLPPDFASLWRENHALYPRGVDVVLCAGTALAALPRSVLIEGL
ncbi:MAG: phosphonate C-P lyase system protein PhnH [Pseudomonadota bacterium]|nr:phosphonate C-P lyase system protein PhnH [Pseudomonadota bacterium]